MITAELDYQAPADLKEALRLVSANPDAKLISGGMSLVPMMTVGLVAPELLVSLKNVAELKGITEERKHLVIGAMTSHREVATHPLVRAHAPLLADTAALIGDVQVRNRGTIGGSVAHSDPAANYPASVLTLDAKIEIAGQKKRREVDANTFFTGLMETAVKEGEILSAIRVPKRKGAWGASFQKFARVKGNYPIVCAAALVDGKGKEGRVAVGGVCATPVRVELPRLDGALTAPQREEIESSLRAAIANPMGDANGGPDYKVAMAVVFALRAVTAALEGLGE